MKDRFADRHPLVNFIYFALVIAFSMALQHPLAQGISLVCACAYAVQTEGRRAVRFCLKWCLPIALVTALANPLFSHRGMTVLLYFPGGSPLTLESVLYGISSGVMIVTVMLWFVNFNRVVTTDKLMCLFGRIIPAMSLVLSMTLRFIPRFRTQMNSVVDAQRSLGRDISRGSLRRRMKIAATVLSVMITWALENAIETADSMKSRGYGLPERSAFSVYRWDGRDRAAMLCLVFCGVYLLAGVAASAFGFWYFPVVGGTALQAVTLSFHLVYLILCVMPVALNALEERTWNTIHSKM